MQTKIRVFFVDGLFDCAYSSDPKIELEIVDFDKEKDSSENLGELYDECIADTDMQMVDPTVIHPE